MKILHLADLHFGKNLHSVSLVESGDQQHWAEEALKVIAEEKPQAVIIAGDVYDRGVPSREAVQLCSSFLTKVAKEQGIPVLLTAGNHDGGERLEFANGLLQDVNVYIAGTVNKEMTHWTTNDEYGEITFWLMPYTFPAAVRTAFDVGDDQVGTYTEAVHMLLKEQPIDFTKRNVLIAHQMVLHAGNEPVHSDSETAIGGVGGIDDHVFEGFDYVALGHIHGAQWVGSDRIRYAGAPLCYHFSEATQKKGLLFVEIGEKGTDLNFVTKTVEPLHHVRSTITASLEDIIKTEQENTATNEYIRIELTDDPIPHHARERLTALFEQKGSKVLDIVPAKRSIQRVETKRTSTEELSPDELFDLFYLEKKGETMSEKDKALAKILSQQILDCPDRTDDELVDELVKMALAQEAGQ